MITLLDTSVLIKLTDPQSTHYGWCVTEFQKCKSRGSIVVSDMVYCEFCAGMKSQEDADSVIAEFALERVRCDDSTLFRAAKAYETYKRRKGAIKTNVLPDFIIGAMAEIEDAPLLTTNQKDFLKYFPSVKLIHP